jgi:VWFA-related protein
VVDAVVIDKKNHLVSDLTAEEFEVYEDGVKQKVASFRFESTAAGAQQLAKAPTAAPATPIAARTGNLVSLVFDAQAARDGALMARKAALDYIESGMGPNDLVGVFGIDLGLMVLSPFTQDKAALKQAVETFTSHDAKKYGYLAQEVRSELERLMVAGSDADRTSIVDTWVEQDYTTPAPGSSGEGRTVESPSPAVFTLMRNQLNITMLRTLKIFERFERESQGRNIVTALLSVISGQQSLSGRKVMLLFSEGFPISASVTDQFRSVISAANGAGMTIYTIDVGGLRLINPDEASQVEKEAAARSSLRNPNPELIVGGQSALGRMEDAMRLNVVNNLDELSGDTGGYTIKNTNDLGDGLRRISEELSSHYVLTYSPTNENFNGKYRNVAVKVTRAGDFRIRARRGYYAFRALDNSPVLAHELPLLEQSNQRSLPQDFPLYAKAMHFRGLNGARAVPIYVELPISALKLNTDEKNKTFSSRYAILVLVKDEKQQVVRKLGQEFVLRGPLSQAASVKEQPHLFSRIILLRSGHYTIEAIARDSTNGKMSGIRLPLDVPDVGEEKLRMSSIVLSRGVNPLNDEQKKDSLHPLYFEGQAYFVPNARGVFRKSADKNLLVHFSAYGAKGSAEPIIATIEFLQGARILSKAGGQLPPADASGRIVYLTSFPFDGFPAGQYEIRVTVSDRVTQTTSSSTFVVEP